MTSLSPPEPTEVARAARALARADSVLFITGAGISADSGLPTYRGVGGLYDVDATEEGLAIEDVLSGETMTARPDLTWKYLLEIERACRGAKPNRGHDVIARVAERVPRTVVLTQNVDGLHADAGSRDVVEIHGNLRSLGCTRCTWRERVRDYAALAALPRCPRCDAVVRPDVVLFGEALPARAIDRLRDEVARGFDVVFSIGTTSVFPYIAAPMLLARSWGAEAIEINPGDTAVSHAATIRLRAGAAASLDAILRASDEARS